MKVMESGMPDQAYWESFFDVDCLLERMFEAEACAGDVLEFGCGYGTFTFAAARRCQGFVHAFDIEPRLIDQLNASACKLGIENIQTERRDFVTLGTGLDSQSQAHAMIYNLLHMPDPVALLREAYRVLVPGGCLSLIHWRSDIETPRGPPLDIRPSPEKCRQWLHESGFVDPQLVDIEACCPYHFGFLAYR